MKTKQAWTILGCALVGSALLSLTQEPSIDPQPGSSTQDAAALGILFCDPVTWEVIGPNRDKNAYVHLNTPELIEQRKLSALRMDDPEQYNRLFPKSAEQIALEEKVAFSMLNPVAYQATVSKTPEQITTEGEALWVIMNPAEAFAELQRRHPTDGGAEPAISEASDRLAEPELEVWRDP
jgi:hypothetical protein